MRRAQRFSGALTLVGVRRRHADMQDYGVRLVCRDRCRPRFAFYPADAAHRAEVQARLSYPS